MTEIIYIGSQNVVDFNLTINQSVLQKLHQNGNKVLQTWLKSVLRKELLTKLSPNMGFNW